MTNSTFGKLCESLWYRVTVTFVRTEDELLKAISEGVIRTIKFIDENLSLITKKKQNIMWNKPTIVGACILELSKLFMMDFHYNVMKKKLHVIFYTPTRTVLSTMYKRVTFTMIYQKTQT